MKIEPKVGCIQSAITILGAKWTALILRDLMDGPKRFCELERLVTGINPRTLTARLLELEDRGIVTNDGTNGYELTRKGKDLLPILKQMAMWGDKYQEPC